MSSTRPGWFDRHEAALAPADRRAAALGPAVHATLVAAADRLAGVSETLAVRAYQYAAAAWSRFGETGFARWIELGEELATGDPPCREGALAYFATSPTAFGVGGIEAVAAWCALGRDVSRTSRRLAAAFFEHTASVLSRADAIERLAAWAAAGLSLYDARGWRGALLAQAYFDAAPHALAVLGPSEYAAWAELGAALASQVEERHFFAALPDGLAEWTDAERTAFLAAARTLAAGAPRAARIVYRDLPPALRGVPASVRGALLRVLARVDATVAPALAEFAGLAGALVRGVPEGARLDALALVEGLATRFPAAGVAALRVLPRLYEEAAPAQVRVWFETGTAITAENPAAGRAFFTLESRTSVRVLRAASTAATLEETEGLWRKLIQMLSGEGVTVRGIEELGLRPPLEEFPAEGEVALPLKIDGLPTHEENCRAYRFLAAQLAGRREFGTYAAGPLAPRLDAERDGGLLEELFLLAEGVRIHHRVARAYPGLAGDAVWLGTRFLAHAAADDRPSRAAVADALFALALGGETRPRWLSAEAVTLVVTAVAPLAAPETTVEDALRVAATLATLFTAPAIRLPAAEIGPELLLDDVTGGDPLDFFGSDRADTGTFADAPAPTDDVRLELEPDAGEPPAGGRPLGAEELRRLLEAGARIGQVTGDGAGGGIPITQLAGKLTPAELDRLRRLLAADGGGAARPTSSRAARDDHAFFYDEWDHQIGDYRSRWCRLHERALAGDSGEFFGRALSDHAALLPEIRRQFQRIPPEMYRPVRGLEDGEDFDLNAVTDARADVRARRAPSTRLYRSRVREARDVATLFLLDMSASTDEPLGDRPGRRIIDALKDALVVMTEALHELGDAYAIYGFSGKGRDNVEFYLVKGFGEALGPAVKGRIGGIVPKGSTRMGAALRHATRKMSAVAARAKHLLLLSDGFPQDEDYGEDRRSHVYGLRDTAVALREADAAGITPFCVTVDRAGHDYLREMCDVSRYLVIEDIAALPRELPKIYRRVVRA